MKGIMKLSYKEYILSQYYSNVIKMLFFYNNITLYKLTCRFCVSRAGK